MKWAQGTSGLIVYISMDRPDPQSSPTTVMSTIAKLVEITRSRLRKIAQYLEDKPVLECVHTYLNEVTECMAFGDDWTRDRESRRSVLEKNHCIEVVSCSQTLIALSLGEAESYALQRAATGALQTQHVSKGRGRPVQAMVRSDSSGISGSQSSGFRSSCKLEKL